MGLGLAICRSIIENHGGKLSARSDGKSGAVFQFVLPARPVGAPDYESNLGTRQSPISNTASAAFECCRLAAADGRLVRACNLFIELASIERSASRYWTRVQWDLGTFPETVASVVIVAAVSDRRSPCSKQ